MKGRMLTAKEVESLKEGSFVYIEPIDKIYKDEVGKAKIIYQGSRKGVISTTKKEEWDNAWTLEGYIDEDSERWLAIYEWIEESKTVFLVLDTSGSGDNRTKDVYSKFYHKLKNEFKTINIISHSTAAKFIDIESLTFAGGSYLSSGLSLAICEVIRQTEPCKIIQISDGDNWSEDNYRYLNCLKAINKLNIQYEYYEIFPRIYTTSIYDKYKDKMAAGYKLITSEEVLKILFKEESKNKIEKEVIRTFTYENETIHIVHKDNWTSVRLQDGTIAKCRCHPEDAFDRDKGIELAYYRAKKKQFDDRINRLIAKGF